MDENKEIILKAKALLEGDVAEGLKAFCSIQILTKEELEDIKLTISTITTEDVKASHLKSYLLCKIIENENSSKELIYTSFRQIIPLLKSENHELANRVFDNIHYSLEGYEKQKFSNI